MRDERTPPAAFRRACGALAGLVLAAALSDLPGRNGTVRTPLATAGVTTLARRITLVPILRAGLSLVEPAMAILPDDTRVGFLGMARDEATLVPQLYLERLPEDLAEDEVVALDVMLASGGSAVAALDAATARGARSLRLVALIAAPEGLARVAEAHPRVPVTVAVVDERLDARGFIVPGLGDAGDRLYGAAG